MKALVTGGAGFIGSNLVDALIEKGWTVDIIDDLSTGKQENVNPKVLKGEQGTFYKVSINDEDPVRQIFNRGAYEVIFHFAAWARVPRSIEDPIGTNIVNVDGTLTMLQMAREYKVQKFIYSSSSSVYGDQPTHIMKETMPTMPKSPYALQKLVGELYASMFARLFNMKIASLRYFNVYGKRQLTEGAYTLVIGKFMQQKKDGQKLTIYGDGEQTRAYTYVDDVVRANIMAAETNLTAGENLIMNIGTAEETSVNQIAEMVGGETEHIIPNPRGDFEERRKMADNSFAKLMIGWEPLVNIVEGMKKIL